MSRTNPLVSEFANELPSLRAALESTVGPLPDVDAIRSLNPIGDPTASVTINVPGLGQVVMHYRRSWSGEAETSDHFLAVAQAALALHLHARQEEIDRARSLAPAPPASRLQP